MKKNLPLYITLAVLILISIGMIVSFAIYKTSNDKNKSSSSSAELAQFKTPADILKNGVSLECKAVEKGVETPVYIKNGGFFTKSVDQNILFKDTSFYSWQDGKKQGFIFKISPDQLFQAEQNHGKMGGNDGMMGQQKLSEDFNTFKNSCKAASISDEKFAVPSDIKFVDLSTMMKSPQIDQSSSFALPDFN
ncbi:MAG: hypothetical protein WCK98_06760 [bacterium]